MFYIVSCVPGSLLPDPQITKDSKLNLSGRLVLCSTVADALISITALVIGILGALGLIPGMPPAASYSLIAIGSGIALLWLGCGIGQDCHRIPINVYKKAIDPNPTAGYFPLTA